MYNTRRALDKSGSVKDLLTRDLDTVKQHFLAMYNKYPSTCEADTLLSSNVRACETTLGVCSANFTTLSILLDTVVFHYLLDLTQDRQWLASIV